MKIFDYIVVKLPDLKDDGNVNAAEEMKALDVLGAMGWELVSVVSRSTYYRTAYLKRAYEQGSIRTTPVTN